MNSQPARRPGARARQALTLMELIVVMVILIAVAGILIPRLTGMLTRAHTSTGATNASELSKAIQTHQLQFLGYPNNLDSLVTDLSSGTLFTKMATGGTDLTTLTLNAGGTLDALQKAGITSVTMMSESGATTGNYAWSPTFFPYAAPAGTNTTPLSQLLADGNKVVGLTGAAAAREFATPAGASYAMFGVGKYSTLSRVMQEAPVHFDDNAAGSPQLAYARYAAVFQLTDATGNPLENATLVGVVGIHDDHVAGISDHMAEYWNTTTQN